MTRRTAISTLAGAALATRHAAAQRPTPKPSPRPALCAYSGNLAKIPYQELSGFVKTMGFDGLDLTVMKGGHVDPSLYMVDLDRAFQTVQSDGLDLPMVTTSFISPSQPYAYVIMYVAGQLGARFCRLGTWPAAQAPGDAMRAMLLHNDLAQFAVTGTRCRILPLLTNHAGSYPGRSIPEAEALLAGMDRTAFGYCFDPAQCVMEARAQDAWEKELANALPRLGAISLSDVSLDKDTGKVQPCPLGEGVVDWKRLFAQLAAAKFRGPISLRMDYPTQNDVSSITKDLAFARAHLDEAWPL